MKKIAWISLLFLILLIQSVNSLTISPGLIVVEAKPGYEATVPFRGTNSAEYDMWVSANKDRSDDPLMNYVKIESPNNGSNTFFVKKGESASFIVKIVLPDPLPDNLTPGRHNLYVGLNEVVRPGSGGFAVSTNVYSLILVNVPYPGIYGEVHFSAATVDYAEKPNFYVEFISRGTDTIKLVEANVEIFSENGSFRKLETKHLRNVAPLDNPTIKWVLEPKSIPPGDYKATADVKFDGQQKKIDTNFRIGSEEITIKNTTQKLESGGIQKYDIHIESKWNNVLSNLYADINILDSGVSVEKSKTPFLEFLAPWEKAMLQGYVDTTNLEPKTYDTEITIYNGQKSKKITTELIITGANTEQPGILSGQQALTFIIFSASFLIIILMGINIYLFFNRKKT